MDPNEGKQEEIVGTGNGATNAAQIQLNPAQVEEAKQMTYGRMKQFRRDRMFTSDRERFTFLIDHLKKVRIIDDQNINSIGISPARGGTLKKDDNNRTGSPSKVSPIKTAGTGIKLNEGAHTNG